MRTIYVFDGVQLNNENQMDQIAGSYLFHNELKGKS